MAGPKQYKNISQLEDSISRLRKKSREEERQIREAVKEIRNDLQPAQILKNGFLSLTGSREKKHGLIRAGAVILISFLIKKYLPLKSGSPGSRLIKAGIDAGLAHVGADTAGNLQELGTSLIRQIFGKHRQEKESA